MKATISKARQSASGIYWRLVRKGLLPERAPRIESFNWPAENAEDIPAYGAELDALVRGAQAVEPRRKWGPIYDMIKAEFDPAFYFGKYPDIAKLRMDPVAHYIEAGARENRDPAPWFSTSEYRRKYILPDTPDPSRKINPFYHYLSEGRARGNAARASEGYEGFAASLGLTPQETADLARARVEDVRERLAHGALGEMVKKAAALDPLVAKSWPSALNVRVPPATNPLGIRRIGHYLNLQEQAGHRRARLVILANQVSGNSPNDLLHLLLTELVQHVPAHEIVVISMRPPGPLADTLKDVRVLDFTAGRPDTQGYDSQRTLIEVIRALWPDTVVNLGANIFWNALPTFGKAIAASSRLTHVLHVNAMDFSPESTETVLARFYRGFDMKHHLVTVGSGLKTRLQDQFAVPDVLAEDIHALHLVPDTTHVTSAGDGPRNRIIWISPNDRRAQRALAGIAERDSTLELTAYDPTLLPTSEPTGHWGPLPATPLDFTGVRALIMPQHIDAPEGLLLDATAAGVPIAVAPDETLADHVVALRNPDSVFAILRDLAPVLDNVDGLADRAATLQALLDKRAKGRSAAIDAILQPRPQTEEART